MAISLVNTAFAQGFTSPTNSSTTNTFNLSSGNLVIVTVSSDTYTTDPTVTDTAGNTYTLVQNVTQFCASSLGYLGMFYAKNTTANAANAVTCNFGSGSGTFIYIDVLQYSGCDATNPLDTGSVNWSRPFGPGSNIMSVTYSTTSATEVVIAACGTNNSTTFTAIAPFTMQSGNNDGNQPQCWTEDFITSSTQTGATASFQGNQAFNGGIVVAGFIAGGAAPTFTLMPQICL